jgi:hypothetical protein
VLLSWFGVPRELLATFYMQCGVGPLTSGVLWPSWPQPPLQPRSPVPQVLAACGDLCAVSAFLRAQRFIRSLAHSLQELMWLTWLLSRLI